MQLENIRLLLSYKVTNSMFINTLVFKGNNMKFQKMCLFSEYLHGLPLIILRNRIHIRKFIFADECIFPLKRVLTKFLEGILWGFISYHKLQANKHEIALELFERYTRKEDQWFLNARASFSEKRNQQKSS